MLVVAVSTIVLWVISLCLHEYAHARVAYAGGDHSVADKGYLSMNPLAYMHPMMSVVIPIIILAIGGIPLPGGAVYIDHTRLRSRHWESAVSLAGPAANFALFATVALVFKLGLLDVTNHTDPLVLTIALFAFLQAVSTCLNMLPIPGLDGFGAISPYLPYEVRRFANEMANVGIFLLLVLFIATPGFSGAFLETTADLCEAFGIPRRTLVEAYDLFRQAFGRG